MSLDRPPDMRSTLSAATNSLLLRAGSRGDTFRSKRQCRVAARSSSSRRAARTTYKAATRLSAR